MMTEIFFPFNSWERNIVKVWPPFFVYSYALVAKQDVKLFPRPNYLKLKLLWLFINETFDCKINSFALLKFIAIAHS